MISAASTVTAGYLFAEVVDALTASIFLIVIALGLYIVFGLMKVINLAHGEMFMLGAYTAWWTTAHGLSFWLALIVAALLVGLVGVVIEVLVIRHLYARNDLSTLLATAGLSLLIQRVVSLVFGGNPRSVNTPLGGRVQIAGQFFLNYQLLAAGIALLAIIAVLILFQRTSFGLQARATIENAGQASVMAIDGARISRFAFGLGAAIAGFAGALMAPLIGIQPTMGTDFVVRSFLVVITGGASAIGGTIGGGAIVGGGQSLLTANFNATFAQIVVLAVVMLLVVLRPNGVFTRRGRNARG